MFEISSMRTKFQQVIDLPNGFGSLKFGFTRGEVENVLGRPDEEDLIDETEMAAIWYYKRLKLSVSFYAYPFNSPATKDMPLGVVTFMTGSPSATLWGSKIVG